MKASTLRWMCSWLRGEWPSDTKKTLKHNPSQMDVLVARGMARSRWWEMWADRATEPKPPISQYWRQLRRLRSANFSTPWEVSVSGNNFVISVLKFVFCKNTYLDLIVFGRASLWLGGGNILYLYLFMFVLCIWLFTYFNNRACREFCIISRNQFVVLGRPVRPLGPSHQTSSQHLLRYHQHYCTIFIL